ncbi:asparaginase domain-containing protein [Tistrella mobilis]|uniref:asparaginase domain-containing protein n=1 Tax=Tistrella mobilis TaxID=171437 RepID=UPI0035585BA7
MRLLLIHTGGTIGMGDTPRGLGPVDGLVEAAIEARLPKGVRLTTRVFTPLLDSADVGPAHWNRMLDLIDAHPGTPVIVTHGTDTMAFTGAALSQALAGLGRHVVLCGAMQPLGRDGDAEGNLDLAIDAALRPGEAVILAFAGRLLPADGLVKHDSQGTDSFRAIPQAPACPPHRRRFSDRRLGVLSLSPGMPAAMLRAALAELDGAVLRVFGAGTAMADPKVLAALCDAVRTGRRIRAVSQCEQGGLVPGSYAAGAGLWSCGVENGGSETTEAALVRLWLG